MNLDTIPDEVWNKLAAHARFCAEKKVNVYSNVGDFFYSNIYETWARGKINYQKNQENIVDPGWREMVKQWFGIAKSNQTGKPLGKVLKDDSVGVAAVQHDAGPDAIRMARLWEQYNDGSGDRFQFVVNAGGGMVLFNRMRRACQTYIIEKLNRKPEDSVIMGWKVFGESAAEGRSDSSVVYLACAYTDPRLVEVINSYIWPNIKDLVEVNFQPLGFYSLDGKPLWAMRLPNPVTEQAVIGDKCHGSAGGLMANVFGKAFTEAGPTATSDVAKLAQDAKAKARLLVDKLYA